jgi:hypothetical protein
MRYAPLFLLLAGCSFPVPGLQSNCTAAHGGDPRTCWTALHLDKPRPATGNSYHSAGTMSLAHATCVKPDSQWWFHAARNPYTKVISSEGNNVLRHSYQFRYPRVAEYLDGVGALDKLGWTKLKGNDLNKLGVPLCK